MVRKADISVGAALPAMPTAFEAGRQVAPGARPTIVGPLCLDGGLSAALPRLSAAGAARGSV